MTPSWAGRLLAAALLPAAAGATSLPGASTGEQALVVVRTLVIDALGTRTVDTDSARVPFGSRGLLLKRVPYAGPPLSVRLSVLAGAPQVSGIPLTLSAEIWSGDIEAPPPPAGVSRREEATVLSPESSYLLEIDHDSATDRRIVLSLSVRALSAREIAGSLAAEEMAPAALPVRLLMSVSREEGSVVEPLDQRTLSTMLGLPVSYSSGVRVPDPGRSAGTRFVGLSVVATPERAQGDLVTVRLDLSGAAFVDEARTRLEPFERTTHHTVTWGTRFESLVTVPAEGALDGPQVVRPVTFRVSITPSAR